MTEYTLAEESSIAAAFSGAELLGVSQAGVYKKATVLDLMIAGQVQTFASATFAGTNTFNGAANFNGAVVFSNSGFSTLVATTRSGKVGFWGKAGTSQRTNGAQVTMTLSTFSAAASYSVAFTSTAQASLLFGQVQEMRTTLVDLGVWKGS